MPSRFDDILVGKHGITILTFLSHPTENNNVVKAIAKWSPEKFLGEVRIIWMVD